MAYRPTPHIVRGWPRLLVLIRGRPRRRALRIINACGLTKRPAVPWSDKPAGGPVATISSTHRARGRLYHGPASVGRLPGPRIAPRAWASFRGGPGHRAAPRYVRRLS